MASSMANGQAALNIVHASAVKLPPTVFVNPKSIPSIFSKGKAVQFLNLAGRPRNLTAVSKASSADGMSSRNDAEEGVSLGTMKLPANTDISRFEILLFQWGNSLCQGANLPLPVPLKVDKIPGGARLCFINVDDGQTEILVYIDCLVFPGTDSSAPMFRAIRNGPSKDQPSPGEPRIMRSLLDALKKCVEIARV